MNIDTLRELAEQHGWRVEPHQDGFVAHRDLETLLVRNKVEPLVAVTAHMAVDGETHPAGLTCYESYDDAAALLTR